MDEDKTDPSFRTRVERAREASDPVIDRILLWAVESRWSPVIVVAYTVACVAFGIWIGLKP